DANTNQVLMLGYMNEEAYQKTLAEKRVWFFSRSKNRLWLKGETSKNYFKVMEIKTDCDHDATLIKVKPAGPACHTGNYSCFGEEKNSDVLRELFELIKKRKKQLPQNSYTASLFKAGLNKICAKVEEESGEVINAAKNETKQRLVEETADLLYHLFVLLAKKGVELTKIEAEMKKRKK
ncbi:MAG: bifunctional phosphoribosyl-AMP cyclohydrolase/phosphoribosyl-ATP diphosphatase HisIE, partial [Patescibacteria group bacterium]